MVKLSTSIGLALAFASTSATAAPAAKSAKPPERQYCIQFEDTGSHIRKTECRTKAEWLKLGVDVDDTTQG